MSRPLRNVLPPTRRHRSKVAAGREGAGATEKGEGPRTSRHSRAGHERAGPATPARLGGSVASYTDVCPPETTGVVGQRQSNNVPRRRHSTPCEGPASQLCVDLEARLAAPHRAEPELSTRPAVEPPDGNRCWNSNWQVNAPSSARHRHRHRGAERPRVPPCQVDGHAGQP